VASAILPITWVMKTSAVRDGAPRVYSFPTPCRWSNTGGADGTPLSVYYHFWPSFWLSNLLDKNFPF